MNKQRRKDIEAAALVYAEGVALWEQAKEKFEAAKEAFEQARDEEQRAGGIVAVGGGGDNFLEGDDGSVAVLVVPQAKDTGGFFIGEPLG